MFWRLFVKDPPAPLLDSLEGIVFKEGKGRFFKRFWKKRLLVYDEVAKCLRYYTPQRALKGTIHLHDILFITPGRSLGRDTRKDSVFEITVPGRVYVFHVNNIRETKKWIGILSRELDNLKIRDRIQLNNGNVIEGTYSKTLRPNSAVLSSFRIGDHREHEECCFLFDEEHQHKVIALESLCSLQAMKIYELSHEVDKISKKCADLETPPSEEIRRLKDQYNKLRVTFEIEKHKALDLKAIVEEVEEKKSQEQNKLQVRQVEKHHHMDFVKVLHVEKGESSKSTPKKQPAKIPVAPSFINLPNSDKSRMEEIKRLQEELEHTKALLATERARALEFPRLLNFNSPSPSPVPTDSMSTIPSTSSGSSTPNRSPAMQHRSATPNSINSLRQLQAIPENTAINSKLSSGTSYKTFSPASITSAYLDHHVNNTNSAPLYQLTSYAPSSPLQKNPPAFHSPSIHTSIETIPILTPQPRYPPQPFLLDPLPSQIASPPTSNSLVGINSLEQAPKQNGLRGSNGVNSKALDFNVVSLNTNSTTVTTINNFVKTSSINSSIANDFNVRESATITKPRSYSESGPPSFKKVSAPRPNGKLPTDPVTEASRSRTNSNPPPFKYSVQSSSTITSVDSSITLTSKVSAEFEELLNSRNPDDNGWTNQVMAKLNEITTEIASLYSQLQVEREKAKLLTAEKADMLESMAEMTAERAKNQKAKNEMEDLMESTEGKLNVMREALEIEIKQRMLAEAKLAQYAEAQAALHQSIMDDEMPPQPDMRQPLLNYTH